MRRLSQVSAGAVAGMVGPVAFTAAWVVGSLRQAGRSFTAVQISGLAAENARDPEIMIAGFVVLGGCSVVFGEALHRALGGWPRAGLGPRLIQAAGVLAVAAGLLRRDHMMLTATAGESWHNHAHDVVSVVIYVALVAAPLLLAVRFRGDPGWRGLPVPLLAGSAVTAVLLGVFVSGALAASDAVLQRIAITLPLALLTAVAVRLKKPLQLMPEGA
ncbi:MAG TPA: DUF998 domain-containing protein [Streptosporangiaceae bacterium]